MLHRFGYLKQALAILLVFIGSKIFVADLFCWAKFPAELSLGITFALLAARSVLLAVAHGRLNGRGPRRALINRRFGGRAERLGRLMTPVAS